MPADVLLNLRVNGDPVRRFIPAHTSLLDLLREEMGLTGSKRGCDLGDCAACTVLVNGVPRLACITLAADMDGEDITTIEGLDGQHPVQRAFDKHVASQCGFCTPGIVLNLVSLFAESPSADDDTIREALGANICRCTGYTKILAAAREASGRGA